MQSWTRMAGSLVLALLLLLQGATALRSVREKQIKLEDIERDNLQTELLKQQRVEQHQQHPAYQQAAQQAQQAQQVQQVQQEHEQGYHQHYQPQHHFRYEQAPLQHHHHPHHQLAQQHHQQQQLLYQAAATAGQGHAAQGVVPTHIMYLIMPNGNVAAFQLAPHPNHIQQAYYSPSAAKHQQLQLQQAMLGTLYHQHAVQPALQYYQPQYVAAAAPTPAQRYLHQQPAAPAAPLATVHHQPTLSFTSQQAHQLHAQHFR
ncbi:hypothetical protein KUF71_022474 [Frankliniella fusca]|uniref:Cyclin-dependent serine/threonine-protein kinase DDB_G0272797/DDB_G0274007 n=1 Tax=Frankliniella fusca TaxID=407009 RepID=A0AAE1H3N1_9NEOP|nr:hypothetical protein KUF71_022474 [Frankliniella fusca]